MTAEEAFADGVAVITGAGAGIGAGLAREAGQIGMTVFVSDISRERAQAVAREIQEAGGDARAVVTDVRDYGAVEALASLVHETAGDVRLLINNAGIEMLGLTWELTPAQWQAAIEINLNGVFYGVRAFVPRMREAVKRGRQAAIANLSSVGGMAIAPLMTPYTVSKHAVLSLTECLSLEMELTETPIDISVITPGIVRTSIFEDATTARGGKDNWAERNRDTLRKSLISQGMDVDVAARLIFEQLAARQFWVSTHPEMTEWFAVRRADYLRTRERPRATQELRDSLGI
jgi:NAD(P)-dependent dehydrogenase (short-subunit alcohol dehydrogenase family)